MTVLSVISAACIELGLPLPTLVVGNQNAQVRLLLRLVEKECRAQAEGEFPWDTLIKEAVFTSAAGEDQGAIATLAPGFRRMVGASSWNRSNQSRVRGPISAADWQRRKASTSLGPYADFRVLGGRLYLNPAPGAGQTIAFEYYSNHYAESPAGVTGTIFAGDDYQFRLDEELLVLALIWRYRQNKRLEWASDYAIYEDRLNKLKQSNGGGKPTLSLAGGAPVGPYAPTVPEGSWAL